MSNFLNITLPKCEASVEIVEKPSIGAVCVCCLSQENLFINLLSCKHTAFLECLFKFKIKYTNYVCVHCHRMLQKIDRFSRQVEECTKAFNNPIYSKSKAHALQLTKTEITSYGGEDDLKPNLDEPKYELETEVKVEHDFSDDLDVPLAEIKKQVRKRKKVPKKEKPAKKRSAVQTIEQKYEGKLRIVNLTEEEMLNERAELRQEEKYLRLPYKCETCVVGFEFEMAWSSHVQKQHNKSGFTCDLCKSVLSSASSLKEHCRRHMKRYECTICNKRYRDEYSAVQHYNELHSTAGPIMMEFQCPLCDFTTQSHRSLRYHRSKHKQEKAQCNLCGNEFTNKSTLKIHMYTLHKQSAREYSCAPCGKRYRGKSGLFSHMRAVHAHAQSRACAYCRSCRTQYRSRHNLAHHLRTHSRHVTDTEKRFGCDECGSRFISKSTLKSHIEWEHLEIRNNRCTKCSKVFRSTTSLKKHVEFVHEKKRPPRNKICDYCGQGFTTAAILRSHIRTHTGERPHGCSHCSATFAHSSALYNHNRLLHNPDRDGRRRCPTLDT